MSRRLLGLFFLMIAGIQAGPLYTAYMATYPVRHVKKTGRAGKKVIKASGKVVKAIVW